MPQITSIAELQSTKNTNKTDTPIQAERSAQVQGEGFETESGADRPWYRFEVRWEKMQGQILHLRVQIKANWQYSIFIWFISSECEPKLRISESTNHINSEKMGHNSLVKCHLVLLPVSCRHLSSPHQSKLLSFLIDDFYKLLCFDWLTFATANTLAVSVIKIINPRLLTQTCFMASAVIISQHISLDGDKVDHSVITKQSGRAKLW